MPKNPIESCLDQYLETENTDDFGKLLLALIPMTRSIVNRYGSMSHHYEDLMQEVFLTLWKHQSDINKLKLIRMRANSSNKDGFKISTYFFYIIRKYCSLSIDKLGIIYNDGFSHDNFFWYESWMGNIMIDEGKKKFKEEIE